MNQYCMSCGFPNQLGSNFCNKCGKPIGATASKPTTTNKDSPDEIEDDEEGGDINFVPKISKIEAEIEIEENKGITFGELVAAAQKEKSLKK